MITGIPPGRPNQKNPIPLNSRKTFKPNAGHGDMRVVKEGDKEFIEKTSSMVEAYAYAKLYDSQLGKGMPEISIVRIQGNLQEGVKTTFDLSNKNDREAFIKKCEENSELGQTVCTLRLSNLVTSEEDTVLDVKIGTITFDDGEAKRNGRDTKSVFNKLQMDINTSSAKQGGANGYQVAQGSKFSRQLEYKNQN